MSGNQHPAGSRFASFWEDLRWSLVRRTGVRPLKLVRVDDLTTFHRAAASWKKLRGPGDRRISHPGVSTFAVPGFCWVDAQFVDFMMDDRYAGGSGDQVALNWRERMVCPQCALISRWRSAIHVFELHVAPAQDASIWLMEQVSPLYAKCRERFPGLVGSEYLSPAMASGATNGAGIRHEDATGSSFPANSLDAIMSFDVFEHVPDFRAAFAECFRVLKSGGTLFFTVPFLAGQHDNRMRARLTAEGTIEHLFPAQFHGDPVQPEKGVLCFHEFGWQVLDDLRSAGFRDAYTMWFESSDYGYPGDASMVLVARK